MPRQVIYECEACGHQMWMGSRLSSQATGVDETSMSQQWQQSQPPNEEPND